MESFTRLTAIAAPLDMLNVDTDMIIPKQFLKTVTRSGLGRHLFEELRRTPDGADIPDFILNRDPWRQARILVTGANFGCGSSREHAPWALADFGIRCVIAASLADIFHGNCCRNGILPVILPETQIRFLLSRVAVPETAALDIDLPGQEIRTTCGTCLAFSIDPELKRRLTEGLDDIALTLACEADITAFEQRQAFEAPWLAPRGLAPRGLAPRGLTPRGAAGPGQPPGPREA